MAKGQTITIIELLIEVEKELLGLLPLPETEM